MISERMQTFKITIKPFNAAWNLIFLQRRLLAMRLPEDMLWHVRTVGKNLHGTSLLYYIGKLFIAEANINAVPARERSTEMTVFKDTNDLCTKAMSYGDYRSKMIWITHPTEGRTHGGFVGKLFKAKHTAAILTSVPICEEL